MSTIENEVWDDSMGLNHIPHISSSTIYAEDILKTTCAGAQTLRNSLKKL